MGLPSAPAGSFSVPAPAVRRAGLLQRGAVWSFLQRNLSDEPANILVIGAGEGEDAMYLTRLGHNVLGLEADAKKIETAQNQAQKDKCPEKPKYHQLSLGQIHGDRIMAKFDVIYAGFGVLNQLDSEGLARLLSRMPRLLKPGGQLFLVLMPSQSAWRLMGPVLFPKRKPQAPHTQLFFHNPEALETALPKGLQQTLSIHPIGVALPPAHIESALGSRITRYLKQVEQRLQAYPRLAKFAEHYIVRVKC